MAHSAYSGLEKANQGSRPGKRRHDDELADDYPVVSKQARKKAKKATVSRKEAHDFAFRFFGSDHCANKL